MQRIQADIFSYEEDKTIQNLQSFLKLKKEINNLQIFDFQAVSICFLVDATGSMKPYVNQVKEQIKHTIEKIQSSSKKNMDIFLSMVAYRDRKDKKKFEILQFTRSVDAFQQFINQLNFNGGGDECEDVKIGLEQVINLEWKQDHLNLLIWMADSPCHGSEFHAKHVSDNYPKDSQKDIELLLKQISELQIDVYFYKIKDTTDIMIKLFRESIFIYDRQLREQNFNKKSFSINIQQNFQNSTQSQTFSQFIQFTNKLLKTNQIETAIELKSKIKQYQKMIIEHEQLNQLINNLEENIDEKSIQDTDIANFEELEKVSKKFRAYKFKLNYEQNKIDIVSEEVINLEITIDIIGQGSFKDVYLAQDQDTGTLYALKKFKNSNQFDFDNLITEYYIYLLSKEIRNSFIEKQKANTDKKLHKNLKMCFDNQWIVKDCQTSQFYIQEVFKIGFQKYINNDGRTQQDLQKNQELFQSFLHYSFEYSNYNYILSDIQGFGNTLNDISIHSQKFIDSFQNVNKIPQLIEQFEQERQIDMQKLQINFPIYANLGVLGIVLFFNQHKCSSYCKSLQLKTIEQYNDLLLQKISKIQSQKSTMSSISEYPEYQSDIEDNYSTKNSERAVRSRIRQSSPSYVVQRANNSKEKKEQLEEILKLIKK
ncbi:hypothetical protein ABPG72_021212 [Tetrahymena utriculariae]